jgi:CRP-like cAMP-binding protein
MKTILESDSDYLCDIQAPCFQNLNAEEAELVRESKTQVLFRKGDSLTKQGAFAAYVLFVVSGFARQYIEGESSKSFNIRIVRPGEFLGLSSVFAENKFRYSSTALTDCRVFLVDREAVVKLARQNGQFGFNLIRRYCEQNSGYLKTIGELVYKQMNGRLAEILLYLDNIRSDNPEIFNVLSRKDLAEFTGISTESAVKLLKSFEKDGLIELHEKDIIIRNYSTLAEISRRG